MLNQLRLQQEQQRGIPYTATCLSISPACVVRSIHDDHTTHTTVTERGIPAALKQGDSSFYSFIVFFLNSLCHQKRSQTKGTKNGQKQNLQTELTDISAV